MGRLSFAGFPGLLGVERGASPDSVALHPSEADAILRAPRGAMGAGAIHMIKTLGARARTPEPRLAAVITAGLLLAGCGGSTNLISTSGGSSVSSSATVNSTSAPSSQPQKSPSRRFVFQVNVVCRTVRQGAPPRLAPPYTPTKVTGYSSRAQPIARRTMISLQRLAVLGAGHAGDLPALIASYEQLSGVYVTAAATTRNPAEARQLGAAIQQHEQAVTATARGAGFPACAVSGG